MWLASCWGQAVSSMVELEVGILEGGGKKLEGGRGRVNLDLTRPASGCRSQESAAWLEWIGHLPAESSSPEALTCKHVAASWNAHVYTLLPFSPIPPY